VNNQRKGPGREGVAAQGKSSDNLEYSSSSKHGKRRTIDDRAPRVKIEVERDSEEGPECAFVLVNDLGLCPFHKTLNFADDKQIQDAAATIAAIDCVPWDAAECELRIRAGFGQCVVSADGANGADDRGLRPHQIVRLVTDARANLFKDSSDTAYATIQQSGHRECHRIESKSFLRWVSHLCFKIYDKVASATTLADAIRTLEGQAIHAGDLRPVFIRTAEHNKSIYLDIGDPDWQVVEVSQDGWRVISSDECPVLFRRTSGIQALPIPQRSGSLSELRKFINVGDDKQWALLCGWLVMALRPSGPYPVLAINSEHGSGKSSMCRMIRSLIDPSSTLLRRPPRDERDMMIAANNSWIVAYDNLSGLRTGLSDSLCVLATGGGFGTRKLYTDDDETIIDVVRPVLINGIDNLAQRADLLDRCIQLHLPTISDADRLDEATLYAEFNATLPRIFGGLLDALSAALRNIDNVKLGRSPRMKDFARWAVAAESALGLKPGEFMQAYESNRDSANVATLEASTIGHPILTFMADKPSWQGTATELIQWLKVLPRSDSDNGPAMSLPAGPREMRSALERIRPNLRQQGISVNFEGPKGHDRKRLISIVNERFRE